MELNLNKAVKTQWGKDRQNPEFSMALSSTEESYTLGFMRGVDYAASLLKLQSEIKKPVAIVLDEENARTLHY